MTVNEIVQKNRERLAIIRSPYNPITGEGSTSISRKKVYIKDCPIEEMYLPEQFAETGFVKNSLRLDLMDISSSSSNRVYRIR